MSKSLLLLVAPFRIPLFEVALMPAPSFELIGHRTGVEERMKPRLEFSLASDRAPQALASFSRTASIPPYVKCSRQCDKTIVDTVPTCDVLKKPVKITMSRADKLKVEGNEADPPPLRQPLTFECKPLTMLFDSMPK
jgi:hypothetical protein